MRYLFCFFTVLFFGLFGSCSKNPVISGDTLISDVNVVDVASGVIMPHQDIVIRRNRIAHIANADGADEYKVARTLNASGKYIIPGLWDMHAHPDDPEVWRMHPGERQKDSLMPLFIAFGVTGIRDMGGSLELVKRWRALYKQGELLAPEIYACGPLLDGPNPMWDGSVGIRGPEQVPEIVDSLMAAGADFLKIYSLLPRDTYFALSKYATEKDIPFAGHVPFTVLPSEAALTGMKSQEHLLEILKECAGPVPEALLDSIQGLESAVARSNAINAFRLGSFREAKADSLYKLFAAKDIWHCPTLSMWFKNAWYEEELPADSVYLNLLPQYIQRYWRTDTNDHLGHRQDSAYINTKKELYKTYLDMVRGMHENGVKLLAGTDTGANPLCFPGLGVHNELQALTEAGLTPAEALKTATINPAEFLGIGNTYGSVTEGKVADLVLLNKNPLAEIGNSLKIAAVIRDGRLLDSIGLVELKHRLRQFQEKE